jgi:uncharacterized protein involved in exopolysaccharide biosynthesis
MQPSHADDELDDFSDSTLEPPGRPGFPVDVGRLLLALRRDWRWIPIAVVVWGLLGAAVAFGAIHYSFKSEGVLLWEPKGNADQRELSTHASALKMPVTLKKVRDRLKLPYPSEALDAQVEVWFDSRSHLVTVQTTGPTPEDARTLTSTLIDVFMDNEKDIARARAGDAASAFKKDLEAARAELQHARKAYDDFRLEHGISDIETETRLAVDTAASLKEERLRAEADASALSARAKELGTMFRAQSPTSVQSASSSNAIGARLTQVRADLAAAQARYSPDHPRLLALQAEAQALASRSQDSKPSADSVVTGANPEYQNLQSSLSTTRADQEAAAKREQTYQRFAQSADQRIAELAVLEGKARTLLADIETVERRISALEVQASNASDELRTPTIEFRVLTPASLAEWPERTRRKMIIMAMPILGLIVGLLAVLLRPLLGGRVYTAREAAFWANTPVIASSAWPRDREAFFPLIDELGDSGGAAKGFTLVIGASPRERAFAEELSYWLGGSSLGDERAEVQVDEASRAASAAGGATAAAAGASRGAALALLPANAATAGHAIVPYRRGPSAMSATRAGTHAWAGPSEGPALRRAARAADRVLVVLTSGTERFTSLAGLRTRLGRDHGVAILVLGLTPDLLTLPDRVGDVNRFWRYVTPRV